MDYTKHKHPNGLLDVLIIAVGTGLIFLASRLGLEVGHPATKGLGSVVGGLYIVYLGILFLLSYFFAEASYVLRFLRHICIACSRPANRHMALFYFAMSVIVGSWLLLIGFGVL